MSEQTKCNEQVTKWCSGDDLWKKAWKWVWLKIHGKFGIKGEAVARLLYMQIYSIRLFYISVNNTKTDIFLSLKTDINILL